jgi:hypothetical protein
MGFTHFFVFHFTHSYREAMVVLGYLFTSIFLSIFNGGHNCEVNKNGCNVSLNAQPRSCVPSFQGFTWDLFFCSNSRLTFVGGDFY